MMDQLICNPPIQQQELASCSWLQHPCAWRSSLHQNPCSRSSWWWLASCPWDFPRSASCRGSIQFESRSTRRHHQGRPSLQFHSRELHQNSRRLWFRLCSKSCLDQGLYTCRWIFSALQAWILQLNLVLALDLCSNPRCRQSLA